MGETRRSMILEDLVRTGVALMSIRAVNPAGEAVLESNDGSDILPAPSVVQLDSNCVGRRAVVAFEAGDARRPVVLGLVQSDASNVESGPRSLGEAEPGAVIKDGERILIRAAREIVLKCGAASITLTRSGKILLRGAYVLSRSSGVNRIKGGSVQIN